jgi:hypothetical protein
MGKGGLWLGMALIALGGCSDDDSDNPQPGITDGAAGTGGIVGGFGGSGGVVAIPDKCEVVRRARLTSAEGASGDASVLWTGNSYLVLWSDARAGAGNADIFMAMLDGNGGRVGNAPDALVVDTPERAISPEVTRLSDGRFVLAWEGCFGATAGMCEGGSSVNTMVLGSNGMPAGGATAIVGPAAVQRRPYVVTAFGAPHLAFRDLDASGKPVARVVRLDGSTATATAVTLGGGAESAFPHLDFARDRLAVVYRRAGMGPEIVLALLGQGLAVERELVVRSGLPEEATNPVVSWNGAAWTVAWEDERGGEAQIFASAAVADASQASTGQALFDGNGNWPTVASNGRGSLVGFYGFPKGAQVLVTRLDTGGNPAEDTLQVSGGSDHGKFPALTYNDKADEYGMVWQDDGSGEVFFGRVKCP